MTALGHALRVGISSRTLTGFVHDGIEDGWWPSWLCWPALDAVTRRDGEKYFDYIDRVGANETARRVKLCDLIDNLTRNGGPSESLRKRYQRALIRLT